MSQTTGQVGILAPSDSVTADIEFGLHGCMKTGVGGKGAACNQEKEGVVALVSRRSKDKEEGESKEGRGKLLEGKGDVGAPVGREQENTASHGVSVLS